MRLSECYDTLNVTPDSAWVEVKRSYHYLAKKYHPDVSSEKQGLSYKFRKINHAFKTLEASYKANPSNNNIRTPSILRTVSSRNSSRAKRNKPSVAVSHKKTITHLDAHKRHASDTSPGWNKVKQTLFEWEKTLFLLDTNKNIHIKKRLANQANIVRVKRGEDTFQVRIPPGPWTRMFIRVPDKGDKSLFSDKRGDLLLNIHVPSNEALSPTNPAFYYKVRIPKDSLRKNKVWILKSTDGPIRFTLPSNTVEGQKFTLKANPSQEDATCSSHIITVHLI